MSQTKGKRKDVAAGPSPFRTRIMLVEDHPLMRLAVKGAIEQELDLLVCGEAGDEATAMQLVKTTQPHLVLVDLALGAANGLDLTRWIVNTAPGVKVLVLSMHEENLYAERALRAGARGYIHKEADPATLLAAIRTVLAGNIYLNAAIIGRILQRLAAGPLEAGVTPVEKLSDRELQTFELIGAGIGSRQVADRLSVSVKTVEAYRQRIKEKLGITTGPELVRRAVEWVLSKS